MEGGEVQNQDIEVGFDDLIEEQEASSSKQDFSDLDGSERSDISESDPEDDFNCRSDESDAEPQQKKGIIQDEQQDAKPEIQQEEIIQQDVKPQPISSQPLQPVDPSMTGDSIFSETNLLDSNKSIDFKLHMTMTLAEQKKRNVIDSVIAEKRDEDSDEEDSKGKQSQPVAQASYQKKLAKISALADESVKEFKQKQKEDQDKQMTTTIMLKAREDSQKIATYMNKLRASQSGGVFTNQLKTLVDSKSFKETLNRTKETGIPENTTMNGGETALLGELISPDESETQKINEKEEVKEKPVKKKPRLQVIEQGEVDWDKVNQKKEKDIDDEPEDLNARNQTFTYSETLDYLKSLELDEEKDKVRDNVQKKQSFFESLFSCTLNKQQLNQGLMQERLQFFALSKLALNTSSAEHEIIVKSIYKRATKQASCRSTGSHWQEIGFQHTNPATDVRGAGMLGLLHLQNLCEYPLTLAYCLEVSQDQRQNFPLAVTSFEFSVQIMELLRKGSIISLCNQSKSVFQATSSLHLAAFVRFMEQYVACDGTITDVPGCSKVVEKEFKSNKFPFNITKPPNDSDILANLKRIQRNARDNRLKALASQKPVEFNGLESQQNKASGQQQTQRNNKYMARYKADD